MADANSDHVTDVELRCPAHHRVLNLIRLFITQVAREMGFSPEDVGKIEMCVDEACANVIEHAYRDYESDALRSNDPDVSVRISISDNSLTIIISDRGKGSSGGFDTGAESLEEYVQRERPRGLGLYIIRQFMDDVRVEFPEESGTRLTMRKFLHGRPTEPSS